DVRDVFIDGCPRPRAIRCLNSEFALGLDAGRSPRLNGHCLTSVRDAAADQQMIARRFAHNSISPAYHEPSVAHSPPGVPLRKSFFRSGWNCRVKPGNDALGSATAAANRWRKLRRGSLVPIGVIAAVRGTKDYGMLGPRALNRLDARCLDNLGPLFDVGGDGLAELGRRRRMDA